MRVFANGTVDKKDENVQKQMIRILELWQSVNA